MRQLKKDILNCLQNLKGSGNFASIHSTNFLFPGLEVSGVGEIAYPINRIQAEALIRVARKAPFGQGMKTIVDNNVRSAWEINASKLAFNNPAWNDYLNTAISKIKLDLGLEDYDVVAHLYKLLIYEKGDFFLPHKDTEKEKGMFGSLIIGLPSKYTGGELIIGFDGDQVVADFTQTNTSHTINYAAFYGDCDHEVKALTSGYRTCLVYNLIQRQAGKPIELQLLRSHVHILSAALSNNEDQNSKHPYITLLGHQYTPDNFSSHALKLNDRVKAEVLLQAAKLKGYYAKMCLVTSYLHGIPEYGDYNYDNEDEIASEANMEEVHDQDLSIEHWAASELPCLDNIRFEESELISSTPLNEGEPIVKEASGYMGNYGPDLMHWYHYGAVMIWSPALNAEMLLSQNIETQLNWIAYFNVAQQISKEEISAVEQIIANGLNKGHPAGEPKNFNALADWLIKHHGENILLSLSHSRLKFIFEKIDAEHWAKLFRYLSVESITTIFDRVSNDITKSVLEQVIAIIKVLAHNAHLINVATKQTALLPTYLQASSLKERQNIDANALADLFWISQNLSPDKYWTTAVIEALTVGMQRQYTMNVLIPELLAVSVESEITNRLATKCLTFMQALVNDKPQPPATWTRSLPEPLGNKKQWQIILNFLESPTERVFDFRRNQSERSDLENAIHRVQIDLKTETIKKGVPHTLRIIKTQDAYERAMRQWNKDSALLAKMKYSKYFTAKDLGI